MGNADTLDFIESFECFGKKKMVIRFVLMST